MTKVRGLFFVTVSRGFWGRSSTIELHYDGTVRVTLGTADDRELYGRYGAAAEEKEQMEKAVSNSVRQALIAFLNHNEARAEELLGEVPEEQIFNEPPQRFKINKVQRRLAFVISFAAAIMIVKTHDVMRSVKQATQHVESRRLKLDRAVKDLQRAPSKEERFYQLDDAAKLAFEAGDVARAEQYASELLDLAQQFPKNWNYGNAIHDGNMVLGRIALKGGRIDDAKEYLLKAGKTPGSPQLNSFGPNTSLAQDLLKKKKPEVVLQYFELCRHFWKLHLEKLDQWSNDVRAGKMPDFGANLDY